MQKLLDRAHPNGAPRPPSGDVEFGDLNEKRMIGTSFKGMPPPFAGSTYEPNERLDLEQTSELEEAT